MKVIQSHWSSTHQCLAFRLAILFLQPNFSLVILIIIHSIQDNYYNYIILVLTLLAVCGVAPLDTSNDTVS